MTILSKIDLAALRRADSVCFDHNVRTTTGPERGSFIRAIKRANHADPFGEDITYRFAVDSRAFTYEYPSDTDNLVGFEMIHSAQVTETWRTIVSLLRVGDDISLVWAAGNGNGYLEKAALHRDELSLVVKRGERKLTFHVAMSVCENNTARMIRSLQYELAHVEGLPVA